MNMEIARRGRYGRLLMQPAVHNMTGTERNCIKEQHNRNDINMKGYI